MGAQSNCTILQVNYLQKLPSFYGGSAPFWLLSCYKQHNSAIKTAPMHRCVRPLKNYLLILVVLPHNLALCYAENAKADTLDLVYISASTLTWFQESTLPTELSVRRLQTHYGWREQKLNHSQYLRFTDWIPMHAIPIEHCPKQSTCTIFNEDFYLISHQELVCYRLVHVYWGITGMCASFQLSIHA